MLGAEAEGASPLHQTEASNLGFLLPPPTTPPLSSGCSSQHPFRCPPCAAGAMRLDLMPGFGVHGSTAVGSSKGCWGDGAGGQCCVYCVKCCWCCSCLVILGQLPEKRVGKCLGCIWLVGERQIGDDTQAWMCRGEYLLGPEHSLSGKCLQSKGQLWGWGAGMGCRVLSFLCHFVNPLISVLSNY